jgi:hypothetical protein
MTITYIKKGKYIVNPDGLTQISMIVTRDCNMRCYYCVEHANYRKDNVHIDVMSLLNAVDKILSFHKYSDIVVTGGEPLIVDELPELLQGLKTRGLNVFLNTNGLLLDEKFKAIQPYIDKLGCSIHDVSTAQLILLKRINNVIPIRASVITHSNVRAIVDRLIDFDCVTGILLRNETHNSGDLIGTDFLIPAWLDEPISSECYNNFDVYYNFKYRNRLVRLKHAQNDKMRQQLLQVKNLLIEPIVQPNGTIGRWWDDEKFNYDKDKDKPLESPKTIKWPADTEEW